MDGAMCALQIAMHGNVIANQVCFGNLSFFVAEHYLYCKSGHKSKMN